jgi:uncharacterized phage infection (PIP) family protein YhgE
VLTPRRPSNGQSSHDESCEIPVAIAETMRNKSVPARDKSAEGGKGDDKISLFWRVCGGTILSISALVVITAYQSHSNALHELRVELNAFNAARAELVKKDEYTSGRTKMWDKLQELQAQTATLAPLADRLKALEEAKRALELERRDVHELHGTLKERLTTLEGQIRNGDSGLKELQSLRTVLAALQEKSAAREQQLKDAEDGRRDLARELQALRERLAKLEGAMQEGRAKPAAPPKPKPEPSDGE